MTPRRKPAAANQRPRWASVGETADYYRVSTDTIRRRIHDGSIKAYRVPGSRDIRVDLNEVDAAMVSVPSAVSA